MGRPVLVSRNVFTLRLLGGAAIDGPEGPVTGRPAQKRRLALLALLAMSRTNRLGREKLVTYLWPDRDAEAARHLLSDAVYVVNRALGADTLNSVGDELRLDPDRLACDARRFEEAAREDPGAAVAAYDGPFMDGFFLDGSEEFESWMARERERLAGVLATSLERLARALESAGDRRGALDAWRRLLAEDPYNSRVAVHVAKALEESGDRAGALQVAQAHAARLRADLGLHAPPDLRDVIVSLQAPPPAAPAPPPKVDAPAPAPAAFPPIEEAAPPDATTDHRADPAMPAPLAPAPQAWRGAALVGVLVVAVVGAAWLTLRPATAPVPLPRSIAVMPFDQAGFDQPAPPLGEGIADQLTTDLGRERGLKVAARTSAFALRGRGLDAREIGRLLGVGALLEGSVRQAEGRIRVSVRLVSTVDGYQVWSESWERVADELSSVEEQIARAVIGVLEGRAVPVDRAAPQKPPVPLPAYQLYLQGRYFWHQRTRDSLTRAVEVFQQALALAPDYAPALSGLADAYAVLGFYDYLPPTEAFPRAKAAARRALEIDPGLAEAHASLGYVALYYDWDAGESEAAFERATALNPSYSVGHQWYANYLTARGRFVEAVAAMRRAQEVDPLSLIASAALGWVHFLARDYEAAVAQCRRTLALNADFELAHLWAGWAHEGAGRYAEAVGDLEVAVRLSSNAAIALASLGRAQALAGDTPAARRTLATLHDAHASYLPAYEMAKLHLALSEPDVAIDWLRRAHAGRSHSMVFLKVDPQLDALRDDPRFVELVTLVGF